LGQLYVNDFNLLGRTWQVNVQADTRFRNEASDMKRLKVRNAKGQMVPIATLADMRQIGGPLVVTRYNMYPAAAVNGNIKTGVSSGDAIAVLEKLAARELPASMHFEWTELTFIEKTSRNTGLMIFGLSTAFVFLVLAALYESWALPLAVILVVPLCVLCSIGGVWVANQDINIFTQVGFVVLIGLACKNAILIVEFAKLKREAGASRREAVLAACQLRYRPILMTSVAFLLGVTPLLFATGAGAEMRKALGVAVFSGMLGVTLFGLLFTPVFFAVVDRVAHGRWSASERLQRVSDVVMYAMSLRFLRDGVKRAFTRSGV
jgi:multidrug efflux pump